MTTCDMIVNAVLGALVLYSIAVGYSIVRLYLFMRYLYRQQNPHLFEGGFYDFEDDQP